MTAQPFPSPTMEPTGFACDGCGRATIALRTHRRPNGDEHWLCTSCQPRAYGSVPVPPAPPHTCTRHSYMSCEACRIWARHTVSHRWNAEAPDDVVQQVAEDREKHAGGPRITTNRRNQ